MRDRTDVHSRALRSVPPPLRADCALFLDIDGTLAELAPSPDAVRIDHAVAAALPRISERLGGALALITGRSITGADRLFLDLILPIAGQHGCERRDANGTLHLHAPAKATLTKLRKLFSDLAARHPGLVLEDKGATLALHYRQAPELASHVHRTLRSGTAEAGATGYELQPGKRLLEIRPDGRDKGTAISDFMREPPFAGRLPVFVGDDRGDEHGFVVVKRMRGWPVKVGPGPTAARYRLPDIAAVRQWLLGLLSSPRRRRRQEPMRNLDLALIGNGRIGALIDATGAIVWGCFPQFDGDPTFCALLSDLDAENTRGVWSIELVDGAQVEQAYVANTAVLVTRLSDAHGGIVELTDCAPRFTQHGRTYQPMTIVRRLRRLAGSPQVVVRLRPAAAYGRESPAVTLGSHHVRFVGPQFILRLTTDASLTAVLEERPFFVEDTVTMLLSADESLIGSIHETGRRFIEATQDYWRTWVRRLAIPFEWQSAVIRAAITLQLNAFDDTGAIVAAMTTSVPEAPDSGRNWDYRYCWLRDSYFVINALNRLGATETMERYLHYIVGIAAGARDAPLQPVYKINGHAALVERVETALPGYRGMGPVRVGNDAYRQIQHDVYGSAILAATHVFFDERLTQRGDGALFARLEPLGRRAVATHDQPDAGLWELRGTLRVHTFSSVMCWAACDRLTRIASKLGLHEKARAWRAEADHIHAFVLANCYSAQRGSFASTAGGHGLDASLLLLAELNFLPPTDARYVNTVNAIERDLRRGDFVFRYIERDDFGEPENAFVVCTFWLVNALAAIGRKGDARALFERLLACRNRHGLLAEHLHPATGEPWGNFVQTYSMVGLINAAIRLSIPWDDAV